MTYRYIKDLDSLYDEVEGYDPDAPVFFDIESDGLYVNTRIVSLFQRHKLNGEPLAICFDLAPTGRPKSEINLVIELIEPMWLIGFNVSYDFYTMRFISKEHDDLFYLSKIAWPGAHKLAKDGDFEISAFDLGTIGKIVGFDKLEVDHKVWKLHYPIPKSALDYAFRDVEMLDIIWNRPEIQEARKNFSYILDKNAQRYIHINDGKVKGLPVNHGIRLKEIDIVTKKIEDIKSKLPDGFNPNSYIQVRKYLGDVDKSDDSYLAKLEGEGNEKAKLIRQIRSLSKKLTFLNTYEVDFIKGFFNVAGAKTGRMTCKGSKSLKRIEYNNMQQIPRSIKYIFNTSHLNDKILIGTDFSQIELRLAASMWGIDSMLEVYRSGEDIHMKTAMSITGLPKEDITEEIRKLAKACNFGLLYGIGSEGFKINLKDKFGIDKNIDEVVNIIRAWFNTYPEIRVHHNKIKDLLRSNGYKIVRHTVCGRPLVCRNVNEALNLEVQGSGGDLVKLALNRASKLAKKMEGIDLHLVNIVHDSIGFISTKSESDMVKDILVKSVGSSWDTFQDIFSSYDGGKCSNYTTGCPFPSKIVISNSYKEIS